MCLNIYIIMHLILFIAFLQLKPPDPVSHLSKTLKQCETRVDCSSLSVTVQKQSQVDHDSGDSFCSYEVSYHYLFDDDCCFNPRKIRTITKKNFNKAHDTKGNIAVRKYSM